MRYARNIILLFQLILWFQVLQRGQTQLVTQTNQAILKQIPLNPIQTTSLFSVIDGAPQSFMAQSATSLFVVDLSSTLIAYAKADGKQLWQVAINQSSVVSTSPVYDIVTDSVYWVGQDGQLHAIAAGTGLQNPLFNATVSMSQNKYNPIVADGFVGVIDYDSNSSNYVFNRFSLLDGTKQPGSVVVGQNYTIPQFYKGNAVFAINPWTGLDSVARAGGSTLTSINLKTGLLNLNQSVPFTITSPIYWLSDQEIYFGASNGDQNTLLYRHNLAAPAQPLWVYNLSPNPRQYFKPALDSLPIVRDDTNMIYVPTRQGFLFAVDRNVGAQMWNVSQPNMTQPAGVSPAMVDYNIVIGSDKRDVFIINVNLTTVQYVAQTTEQVLSILQDSANKTNVYWYDQSGTCGKIPLVQNKKLYNIFQNIHPYFDMSNVTLAPASIKNSDNFTSNYAFDIYWNQTQIAIGFSKLYPMTVNKSENLFWGATDYKLYDNANIQNYTQYNNFNRSFNSYVIAGPGINQANQTVYVGSLDNTLYAVTATNELVWTFASEGPILCDPYYVNNTVYLASSDGFVYSINALTSKGQNVTLNWQKSVGNWTISKPFIYQQLLYVATTSGDIYAIDISSGIGQRINSFPNIIYANGAVDYAGWLYYADKGGIVRRLGRDGTTSWETLVDGAVLGGVTVVNDTVAVATTAGTLYALDRNSGKQQWKYTGLGASFVAPVSYKETFYVGSIDGYIWAINSTDVTVLNTIQLDKNITSISTTENFARDKLLFVATSRVFVNNSMLAVDPTVNSTVYALQPPGATKKYTPQMYVGQIVRQPDDYLNGGSWPQPIIYGVDGVNVPGIQPADKVLQFQVISTLYTKNCISCNQALGSDLGRFISQMLWTNGKIQSVYDSISCPPTNLCTPGRRLLQNAYKMKITQIFNCSGVQNANGFTQFDGSQISKSSIMTNYYGAQNLAVNTAGPAPISNGWTRHQKQIIPVIVVVAFILILVLFSWIFCCLCYKPRDPTIKARVADQGTFENYRNGAKKTTLNSRKPLLNTQQQPKDTENGDDRRNNLHTADVYDKEEQEFSGYEDESQTNVDKRQHK